MAQLGSGVADVSLPISDIEMALHRYAFQPQLGLDQFSIALQSLHDTSKSECFPSLFYQRLKSLIRAVEGLLLSGSPYFSHYHSAFLSSVDALFQVAMACRFDGCAESILERLLSQKRSCWSVVMSIADEKDTVAIYRDYEAALVIDAGKDTSVDVLLQGLSSVGRVSFELDSVQDKGIAGRFMLTSVQSLSWLKRRFPSLKWQVVSLNEMEPLRALCELSFLPLFQNTSMSRDVRYRLLSLYEDRFKTFFYQPFGEYFSDSVGRSHENTQLVPSVKHINTSSWCDDCEYFPVRHGGFFYIAERGQSEATYIKCLGRDYLPSFLYQIETTLGMFAFPKDDSLGVFQVNEADLRWEDGALWYSPTPSVRAKVFLGWALASSFEGGHCLLWQSVKRLLVVKQGLEYFALPCLSIREVEAVSSVMSIPRKWVKNIWLTQSNHSVMEPWLVDKRAIPSGTLWPEKNKSTDVTRNGYYFGKLYDRVVWIEASLVFALLPYQVASHFVLFGDNDPQYSLYCVHDGRSYDRVLCEGGECMDQPLVPSNRAFSIILDWMGVPVVVYLSSCDWSQELPKGQDYIQNFSALSDTFDGGGVLEWRLSSLQEGDLLINKKNYLSFVAGFWPTSLLA